jgi:hypothetical protein
MGYCPRCGNQLQFADERFCDRCGFNLGTTTASTAAQPGPAAAPGSTWKSDPQEFASGGAPAGRPAPAVAPDAVWKGDELAVASRQPAPQGLAGAASTAWTPSAPRTSAGTTPAAASDRSIPLPLVIGGIVIVAIVAVVLVVRSSGSGGISFDPSTVNCSSPVVFTSTVHLPSSVQAGDTIIQTLDGQTIARGSVTSSAMQQPDGSWIYVNTSSVATMQSLCASGGSSGGVNILTQGTHTEQILDSTGRVLASGSYSVTP